MPHVPDGAARLAPSTPHQDRPVIKTLLSVPIGSSLVRCSLFEFEAIVVVI